MYLQWYHKALLFLLAAVCVISIYYRAKMAALDERVEQMRSEIATSERQQAKLKNERDRLASKVDALRQSKPTPGVYQPHLRRIIRATLGHLKAKNVPAWERLILLTVIAESDCGAYTKQLKGPARGIVQVEPATERT